MDSKEFSEVVEDKIPIKSELTKDGKLIDIFSEEGKLFLTVSSGEDASLKEVIEFKTMDSCLNYFNKLIRG